MINVDTKVCCPKCGSSSRLAAFRDASEITELAKLAAKFGRNFPWVAEYLDCFRSAEDRPLKPARMKILLEEILEFAEKRGFTYQRQPHSVRPDALFAAVREVALKNMVGMKNHNYLKKVAINFNLKLIQGEEKDQRQREEEAMRRGTNNPEKMQEMMGKLGFRG